MRSDLLLAQLLSLPFVASDELRIRRQAADGGAPRLPAGCGFMDNGSGYNGVGSFDSGGSN